MQGFRTTRNNWIRIRPARRNRIRFRPTKKPLIFTQFYRSFRFFFQHKSQHNWSLILTLDGQTGSGSDQVLKTGFGSNYISKTWYGSDLISKIGYGSDLVLKTGFGSNYISKTWSGSDLISKTESGSDHNNLIRNPAVTSSFFIFFPKQPEQSLIYFT